MKYFVVAVCWSDKYKKRVLRVVGQFPEYYMAVIFRDAYNERFSANAYVEDICSLDDCIVGFYEEDN